MLTVDVGSAAGMIKDNASLGRETGMKSLKDRSAVITGAGSGIGRELSLQLARAGATTILVDRNPVMLRETAKAVAALGGAAHEYVVDVGEEEEVQRLAKVVDHDLGPASIVINNAGLAIKAQRFDHVPEADLELLLRVNLWGPIHLTRAFLPQLLTQPEASLVNVSSLGGLLGFMDQVPYATAKFGLRGFSEALRMDLYKTNVTVTVVYPGPVATNILLNSPGYTAAEKAKAQRNFEKVRATSPQKAAARIIRGIQKKKSRVLIGPESRAMDIVARLLPAAYTRLLYPPVKKMLSVGQVSEGAAADADRPSPIRND